MVDTRKKGARPLFVLWDYKAHGTENEDIPFHVKRMSAKYVALAEYFLDNPPNKVPFRPRDIGVAAHALQTYRKDVENWVAVKMMNAIREDPEFTDGDLFAQVIRELHQQPWYPGSTWRGFYYVQPMPKTIKRATREDLWALRAMGKDGLPYLKAQELGWWAEPKFENLELWKSRIAINHLRRTVEMYAEAALTGRSIGQLKPAQLFYLVEAATASVKKALPAPTEEKIA
ncbi:MAG: hypothetical protein E6K90_03690 [Thaumarchaeota archaeon]|nr:MAG: hypothetical protein E6K90_03690 [Nitrososphaerota archaeon]